jgi:hypothetical protein
VKLMDFALAGLKLAPNHPEQGATASEFASPEQLERGAADFRSEIYSLGATMCFLLTGAFYSAEPRSLQTRRFVRPLRRLIAPMLRQNPDERPQDPVLFAQVLRACLQKVERRQALARRLGMSFVATKPIRPRHPPHRPPVSLVEPDVIGAPPVVAGPATVSTTTEPTARPRLWPRALALAAILLALATAIAVFVPAPISMILHRNRDKQAIGVPIGVPEPSAMVAAQSSSSVGASMPLAPPFHSPGSTASSASPILSKNNIVANNSQTTSPMQSPAPPQPASSTAVASARESGTANQLAAQPVTPPSEAAPATTPPVSRQTQLAAADASTSTNGPATSGASATQSPASPAEGPETVWQQESQGKQKTVAQNSDQSDKGSPSESKPAAKKTTKRSSDVSSRSRSRSRDIASNTSRMRTPRYGSSRTARIRSEDDGDQFQPPYQPYQQDEPRPRRALPVPEGSFRARVVGTTPEGNLILRLPSGEIAIVPPRHRPRRIWIERSPYFEPPPRPEFGPPDTLD